MTVKTLLHAIAKNHFVPFLLDVSSIRNTAVQFLYSTVAMHGVHPFHRLNAYQA